MSASSKYQGMHTARTGLHPFILLTSNQSFGNQSCKFMQNKNMSALLFQFRDKRTIALKNRTNLPHCYCDLSDFKKQQLFLIKVPPHYYMYF